MNRLTLLCLIAFTSGCNFMTRTVVTTTSPKAGAVNDATKASVQLSWNPSSGAPQGYLIEQSTDNVTFSQVQALIGNTTTTNLGNLTLGSTYYFRIRSYNVQGFSAYTPVVSIDLSH